MWYKSRKYGVNEQFFDTISSEYNAYVLGLVYSDGWVRDDGVGFSSTDLELVEIFLSLLESSHKIREKPKKLEVHKQQYEVFIGSKLLAQRLIKIGCTKSKSLSLVYPDIPYALNAHFVRGLWDGDGMIREDKLGNARMSLVGTFNLLSSVSQILCEQGIPKPKVILVKPNSTTAKINLSGNGNAARLQQFLYGNSSIGLSRKKQKFHDLTCGYEVVNGKVYKLRS